MRALAFGAILLALDWLRTRAPKDRDRGGRSAESTTAPPSPGSATSVAEDETEAAFSALAEAMGDKR